jgi:hypothetical protein
LALRERRSATLAHHHDAHCATTTAQACGRASHPIVTPRNLGALFGQCNGRKKAGPRGPA